MKITFVIKNYHPKIKNSDRLIKVNVPTELAPTDEKVIDWLKRQQPYLIEGEKWEVILKK